MRIAAETGKIQRLRSRIRLIATATIAGVVGGGGLGQVIANPASYTDAGVLGASYCVAGLGLVVAGALALLQRAAFRRMSPTA